MSSEIISFLKNLKDWRKNFSIYDYDYSQYNCEIADIAKMQIEKNADGLIKFWNTKVKNEYFEIKHPIYNDITLRAVYSVYNNFLHNCVFFIDKDNKHILLWVQFSHLINCFLVQDKFFRVLEPWGDNATLSAIDLSKNYLNNVVVENLLFKDTNWGFTFQHTRPYHFFMDCFPAIYKINVNKLYFNDINRSFFIPKKIKHINNIKNKVLFWPCTISMHYPLFVESFEYLKNESLNCNDNIYLDYLKYDLILWIGLPEEKRIWIEQIEGFINILLELNKYFQKIKIFIDGMTSYDGEKNIFSSNQRLFYEFFTSLKKRYNNSYIYSNQLQVISNEYIILQNLIGEDYRTKIFYCNNTNISINPLATMSLVPVYFCKKVFVGFDHSKILSWNLEQYYSVEYYRKCDSRFCLVDNNSKSIHFQNYHIPYEHIYNLIAETLEELSIRNKLNIQNLLMHRLKVSSVELLSKKYKLECQFGVNISLENIILYNAIEECFNKSIDKLQKITTSLQNHQNKCEGLKKDSISLECQLIQLNQIQSKLSFQTKYGTAKQRIQNQLSYKLGQAMIINSKSLLGYIKMPFVLSYIKDKHNQEQKIYKEKIKKDPSLKLPSLENYPDYKEALKEKECLTYKLGQALIQANKTWHKGGYVKLWFEIVELKKRRL
ncbi:hypothetical protein [Campylobacter volucris]|uniref:hypothetical protein n=1 Tax=Campylobacter volucris TaxID=1031542 RepID=UPI001FB5C22B|nr:hypothetical protein [Campylobacter volucris]